MFLFAQAALAVMLSVLALRDLARMHHIPVLAEKLTSVL